MLLRLEEIAHTASSTASSLLIDGKFFCFVVEDGPRDKKVMHETRIPPGRYRILPRRVGSFFTRYSKAYGHKFVPWLQDVPGFTFILIHIGNTVTDTSGCLLVNRFIGLRPNGLFAGQDSTTVYKLLYSLMELALEREEEIWIEVIRKPIPEKLAFDYPNPEQIKPFKPSTDAKI